ncbi:MAG: hypothetical protein ACRC9K_12315 [Afipia sp.]
MSGTSAGWSPQRRAQHSAMMVERNRDPAFIEKRRKGASKWTPERRAVKSAEMTKRNADPAFHAKKLKGIAKRAPRGFTIPKHTHPCVRALFIEMNQQQATRADVSGRANVSRDTLTGWRSLNMPLVDMLDAALGAVDLELCVMPRGTRDENGFPKKKKRQHNTGETT